MVAKFDEEVRIVFVDMWASGLNVRERCTVYQYAGLG